MLALNNPISRCNTLTMLNNVSFRKDFFNRIKRGFLRCFSEGLQFPKYIHHVIELLAQSHQITFRKLANRKKTFFSSLLSQSTQQQQKERNEIK